MNRRSFIAGILAMSVAPMFLPGGGRIWKATYEPVLKSVSVKEFCKFLDARLPLYDDTILSTPLQLSSWLAEFTAPPDA